MMKRSVCEQCGKHYVFLKACYGCSNNTKEKNTGKRFCSTCLPYLLETRKDGDTDIYSGAFQWQRCFDSLHPFCSHCLLDYSSLDGSTSFSVTEYPSATSSASVVLIHGGNLSRASMIRLQEELSKFNLFSSIVRIDLPGHGSLHREKFTQSAIDEVVKGALELTSQGPVILFGHSLGGYVAYQAAAVMQDRDNEKQQIVGVITSGASVFQPMPALFRFLLWLTKKMPPSEQHKMMLKHEFGKYADNYTASMMYEAVTGAGQFWGVIDDMKEWLRTGCKVRKWMNDLSERNVPVLLINGSQDSNGRVKNAHDMVRRFNGSVSLEIINGNHMLPIGEAHAVANLIIPFCQDIIY